MSASDDCGGGAGDGGRPQNVFSDLSGEPGSESFLKLVETAGLTIERIVSRSHASPKNFWYDQDRDEWVLVLKGEAVLEFEGGRKVRMKHGDHLRIPKHQRHRVEQTSEETVWLAVHLKD
jgi:cupin 2 domain-containing protein